MGFGSLGENPKGLLTGTSAGGASITGIRELDRALRKFEKKVNKKVMRKAMTKVLGMFRKEVRRRTPKGPSGNLRKSVTTQKKFLSRNEFFFGRVFHGTKGKRKGFHAHWLEWGTDDRFVKDKWGLVKRGYRQRRRKMNVGKISPAKMSTDAFAAKKAQGIRTFRKALIREINKVRPRN